MTLKKQLFPFKRINILSIVIVFVNFSVLVNSECFDKPQLFLHKKGIFKEQLDRNDPIVTLLDVSREYISCRSSRNVQWNYIGQGAPSKILETAEVDIKSESEDGSLNYCMTSKITFYPKQSDTDLSKHTGRYVCQEIGNSSNQASAYVYVGRRNAPIFLDSRKVLKYLLSQENLTDSTFTIPCVTSTPSVNVTLLKRSVSGSGNSSPKYQVFVNPAQTSSNSDGLVFDPKYGFQVDTTGQELSTYYGDYKCLSKVISGPNGKPQQLSRQNENGDEDFVIFTLFKPSSFKVTPPTKEVFTSTILNLTCESTEEPVILKEIRLKSPTGRDEYNYEDENEEEDPGSDSLEDLVETLEKNEQKNHVANYLDDKPIPGSFGEFQCINENDKRVLHSWKYRILDKKEEKLSGIKFNKRDNSFSCKTKTGMPGKMSFVSCKTPSECQINRICLEKSENCRGYSNATKALCHRGNHFCGKIFYKGGSGLIRCIGEGIDQIRGFTDEANDQRLRMGFHKLKPSETVLLTALEDTESTSTREINNDFSEGDEIAINLKFGHYFFVYPMQWAIKLRNGSSLQIAPETEVLKKSKLYRTVEAKIRLPFIAGVNTEKAGVKKGVVQPSEIIGINALIPLRSSVDPSWKTITLPIRVTFIGKEKVGESEIEESNLIPTARSDIELVDEVTEFNVQNTEDTPAAEDEVEFVTQQVLLDSPNPTESQQQQEQDYVENDLSTTSRSNQEDE